ncbi:hypothetical protein KA078_00605 [Candidatus Woesebacteria bacterium]|nr:hypothetical protein [Candidatus Woesebacteria bacterium]
MSKKRNVDMSTNDDVVKVVQNTEVEETAQTTEEQSTKKSKKIGRSKRYAKVRSQIDRTKFYAPLAAIELVKKLSYSSFAGTITADIVAKDTNVQADLTLPHSTGKTVKVAIADDELLKEIEKGTISFDILVSSRQFVPKLAKFAKILGPRGLMPNPKNGTITENPEAKKKELEGGKMTVKTEKKQPIMHITLGKTNMESQDLADNLSALMTALQGRILRVTVSATMSPGVKVEIS